jgi:hypothetical protein
VAGKDEGRRVEEGADVDGIVGGAWTTEEIVPPTMTYLPDAIPASTSAAEISCPLSL